MAHYNSVAEAMTRSPWIEPIYEVDPNSDEVMWEPWIDGFTRAMGLRPDAWDRLLAQADEETRTTMIFLMALQEIYTGHSKFTDEEIDEIDLEAPNLIPNCVATILYQSRPELSRMEPANRSEMPFNAGPRPGRNDPCSCGSGRKYKACHLNREQLPSLDLVLRLATKPGKPDRKGLATEILELLRKVGQPRSSGKRN